MLIKYWSIGNLILFITFWGIHSSFPGNFPEIALKIESTPTDYDITFTWSVPIHVKYEKIILIRKEKGYPLAINDGKFVYSGTGTSAVDKDLVANTEYYYAFFLLDRRGGIIGWTPYKEKT